MPPARVSAAAEETVKRASSSKTSRRDTGQRTAAVPDGTGTGDIGGTGTGVGGIQIGGGQVDWDAIFQTIDGQGSQLQAGNLYPGQLPNRHPNQGYEYDPGPSTISQAPSRPQPTDTDIMQHAPFGPWSSDPFGLTMLASGSGSGQSGQHDSGNTTPIAGRQPRPPPQRSHSYPHYQDPFQYSEHLLADQELSADNHQHYPPQIGTMGPPLPLAPPFGPHLGGIPDPLSRVSSAHSSPSLTNTNYMNRNFTPVISPIQGGFGDTIPRNQPSMDPPPNVRGPIDRRPASISHPSNFDFSAHNSNNNSPAPTPLSNPASGEDSEDKRVRNTVASAKFRAKKKEQIASVQRTINDLEAQHAGLEADVASLRNENGLLREMVQIKFGTKIPEN